MANDGLAGVPPALTVVEIAATEEHAKPKPSQTSVPKWETETKERIRTLLRRLSKPLADAVARDANEADTRMIVTDILRDGLGYDTWGELSAEYQVKGDFADFGVRIDQQLAAFVEVKRATTKLNPKHLRQVELYAVNEGVEWLILTNAVRWQVYHLTPGMPVTIDLAFEVDLLDSGTALNHRVEKLFYLHKRSMKRRQIDELWRVQAATSPAQVASVLLSGPVLLASRRELWRRTGQRVSEDELARILAETVLRPDSLPDQPKGKA